MESIKGTYIYSHAPESSLDVGDSSYGNEFSIFFKRDQGTTYGGIVAGKLMAVSVVVVMIIAFKNHEYHTTLPCSHETVQVNQEGGEHSATGVIDHHLGDPVSAVVADNNNMHAISNLTTYVASGSSNTLNCQPSTVGGCGGGNVNLMHWNTLDDLEPWLLGEDPPED